MTHPTRQGIVPKQHPSDPVIYYTLFTTNCGEYECEGHTYEFATKAEKIEAYQLARHGLQHSELLVPEFTDHLILVGSISGLRVSIHPSYDDFPLLRAELLRHEITAFIEQRKTKCTRKKKTAQAAR